MAAPTRSQLDSFLIARFPQLQPAYEELTSWRNEPGGHLVYSTLFSPYVRDLLQSPATDSRELEAVFAFVEELARNQADGVREVLTESVLVALVEKPQHLQIAWPFMGEATRRIVQAIAKASG